MTHLLDTDTCIGVLRQRTGMVQKLSQLAPTGLKHAHVFATLRREIQSGRWRVGDRLPSEAELVRRFGHSRITVGRALRDLQVEGLIERRAGSGTYVRGPSASGALSFGLLIPDLGETHLRADVPGMMDSPLAPACPGVGSVPVTPSRLSARQLALHYLSACLDLPLEHTPD
jgi:DNA-binding transcriptional MocR family regulator